MKSNEQQTMEAYDAPKVEVIVVEVEKGFSGSDIAPYREGDGWR